MTSKRESDSDSIDSDSSNEDYTAYKEPPKWETLNLHSGAKKDASLKPNPKPRASLQSRTETKGQSLGEGEVLRSPAPSAEQLSVWSSSVPSTQLGGAETFENASIPRCVGERKVLTSLTNVHANALDVRPKQKPGTARNIPPNLNPGQPRAVSETIPQARPTPRIQYSREVLWSLNTDKEDQILETPKWTGQNYEQAGNSGGARPKEYSKVDEKLTLADFLPKDVRPKEKVNVQGSQTEPRPGRYAQGDADEYQNVAGNVGMNVKGPKLDRKKGLHNSFQPDGAQGRERAVDERRGFTSTQKSRPLNGYGSSADSDDDAKSEDLFPATAGYVPPRRQQAPRRSKGTDHLNKMDGGGRSGRRNVQQGAQPWHDVPFGFDEGRGEFDLRREGMQRSGVPFTGGQYGRQTEGYPKEYYQNAADQWHDNEQQYDNGVPGPSHGGRRSRLPPWEEQGAQVLGKQNPRQGGRGPGAQGLGSQDARHEIRGPGAQGFGRQGQGPGAQWLGARFSGRQDVREDDGENGQYNEHYEPQDDGRNRPYYDHQDGGRNRHFDRHQDERNRYFNEPQINDDDDHALGQDNGRRARQDAGHAGQNRRDAGRNRQHNEPRDADDGPVPGGGIGRRGAGGQQFGNQQQDRPPRRDLRPAEINLSFTRLRELKAKEPADVLAALSYSMEGLKRLLYNQEKLRNADMMKLLVTALAKVCQCTSMPTQQNAVLNAVRASGFLAILGHFLTVHGTHGAASDVSKLIGECALIARTMAALFGSILPEVVMIYGFIDLTVSTAEREGYELSPEAKQRVGELDVVKTAAVEGHTRKESSDNPDAVNEDFLTPPEDFRTLSVFPTMADLDKDELLFLRKNKARGGYRNLGHYLDVQFRLLREDFVFPLREGIQQYLEMVSAPHRGKKLKDIRVYHRVHVMRAVCLQGGLGHRLNFDVSRLKRVPWEVSKRLIYGSLVCLSADNFHSLFFATVANRDPAELREGIVDVTFEHNLNEIAAIGPDTEFTMAETTAFFEAYRHVLSGLQNITTLPFDTYIVQCQKTVREPVYLNDSRNSIYDLRPLVDSDVVLREDRQLENQGREVGYNFTVKSRPADDVAILHREMWPDPQLLELDDTQFEALNRALTKEFSVIQGPPGTGKTYVGLKIVKALLHNRKSWDPKQESSMLIVCYTNHALDQFLEGVVSFFKGRVVRVGSRLRSEQLEKYTLSNLRWDMRKNREEADRDFREITRLRFQGHEAMDSLKTQMDSIGLKIEGAKLEVLHEDVLRPYMLDEHYERLQDVLAYLEQQQQGFVQQGKTKKKMFGMLEWLGLGSVQQTQSVTVEDLEVIDQELGEDELELEGEIQALEDRHRLDTDDAGEKNEKKKKEKKRALAAERSQYLALDISRLDQGLRDGGGRNGGQDGFQIPAAQWRKIKRKLRRNVALNDRMTEDEEAEVGDIWELNPGDRWRLYRLWTHKLCEALREDMRELERTYDDLARRQKETLMQEDKHILKKSTVIAMTTTAAARYQSVLQEIKPKIVVVEEAAEVLEGHVITTLGEDCRHLILIGDHKQLRPNPTVYKLAYKYNLELSLFERMITNGIKCVTLGHQHRMRPEIADLVKSIYPELNNHPSVLEYENVKGISSNVFFINHNYLETSDDETKSHSNEFEADYVAQLTTYLLKQGYDPSRITVLTTYSGQLYQLKRLMPKKRFGGVRLTVVDNFQGEENDIIVLSLVRSNPDENIGFLKIENRVCVALSRAKIGLFVLGNFDILSGQSPLWNTITTELRKKGRIGDALHLYCQNHPHDDGLVIKMPEDFEQAPEGGCMKPCTARLDCGHVCTRLCHPADQEHKQYNCTKPCERTLDCEFEHRCKKLCYQDCGECTELVQRRLPKCSHSVWMECGTSAAEFPCIHACEARLPCGHTCGDKCGQPHRCYEKVVHDFPCGHEAEIYCSRKDYEKCPEKCGEQLSCGHRCSGTCSKCFSGRLHKSCGSKCTRILVCGHECQDTCSNCPPCDRPCENRCVHSHCNKKCGQPCVPCREPCTYRCPHFRCGKLCSEPCDRPPCDQPCDKLLNCNHPCIGVCGEPCPSLCRICNKDEVTEIFFGTEEEDDALFVELEDCSHVLEVSGLDHWMQATTSENEDSVQLKACPRCKVPIRRNLRYGQYIKQQLQDIETIKRRILVDEQNSEETVQRLEREADREIDMVSRFLKQTIVKNGDAQTQGGLVCMQNQFKLVDETRKLREFCQKKEIKSASYVKAVEDFEKWIIRPRLVFREQEVSDAQNERKRVTDWLHLLYFHTLAKRRGINLPAPISEALYKTAARMKRGLQYPVSHQESTRNLLKELKKLVPESGLGISEEEKVMILQAMQLNQGHWYKCPRGHVYAIGDCGGANQESRCPECNAKIGGVSYRLAEGNAVATEMDGATQAAWSDVNNVNNYGFNIQFED